MALKPFFYQFLLITIVHLSLSSSTSSSSTPDHHHIQGNLWVFEEKARLGSTPPTCNNRCSSCHPCRATEVPTNPSLPTWRRSLPNQPIPTSSPEIGGSKTGYSNYKPVGWKCYCGDRFYDP